MDDDRQSFGGIEYRKADIDFVVLKRDGYTVRIERDSEDAGRIKGFAQDRTDSRQDLRR